MGLAHAARADGTVSSSRTTVCEYAFCSTLVPGGTYDHGIVARTCAHVRNSPHDAGSFTAQGNA